MKKATYILLFASVVISGCSHNSANSEQPTISRLINEEATSTCVEWASEDSVPSRSVDKYVDECVAYLTGERDEPAYL